MWRQGVHPLQSAVGGASVRLMPQAAAAAATFHCAAATASRAYSAPFTSFRRAFHATTVHAQDHYKILGVSTNATKDEIKKQYYKMAKQYHPDTAGGDAKANTERFTKVQNAYEVLGDEKARKTYDRETAYSSTSSYASYSGVRPDEREYSYRTWQTKTPNGSTRRSPFQYEQHEQWEDYVEDDFDEEISEEDLFSDLFGDQTDYRQSQSSSRRKTSSSRSGSGRRGTGSSQQQQQQQEEPYFSTARSRHVKSKAKVKRPVKGADVTIDVHLSFIEAAQGVSKQLEFTADGSCKSCRGSGAAGTSTSCRSCNGRGIHNLKMPGHISMHVACDRCEGSGVHQPTCAPCSGSGLVKEKRQVRVNIPSGVESSTAIRVVNQGHAGKRGGAHGHLLLKAIVASHPIFTRTGLDLHLEYPLPLTTALLGGMAQVPSLSGGMHTVRVEQGTQHLSKKILPGRGIRVATKASSSETKIGAQHVTWRIDMPTELSLKSKDLLKQLALEMGNIHNIDLTADIRQHAGKGKSMEEQEEQEEDAQTKNAASDDTATGNTVDPAAATAAEPESTQTETPRPKRRTRKAAAAAASTPTDEQAAEPAAPPKRRGRPAKVRAQL